MNKLMITIATLVSFLVLQSCEDETQHLKYNHPNWQEEVNTSYSVTMTAIITLPNNLATYQTEDDEMAVFVNETCRGVATIIDGLFFITIKGTSDEVSSCIVKYYNAKNQYLYQSNTEIPFVPNTILGTIDNPHQIQFDNI